MALTSRKNSRREFSLSDRRREKENDASGTTTATSARTRKESRRDVSKRVEGIF